MLPHLSKGESSARASRGVAKASASVGPSRFRPRIQAPDKGCLISGGLEAVRARRLKVAGVTAEKLLKNYASALPPVPALSSLLNVLSSGGGCACSKCVKHTGRGCSGGDLTQWPAFARGRPGARIGHLRIPARGQPSAPSGRASMTPCDATNSPLAMWCDERRRAAQRQAGRPTTRIRCNTQQALRATTRVCGAGCDAGGAHPRPCRRAQPHRRSRPAQHAQHTHSSANTMGVIETANVRSLQHWNANTPTGLHHVMHQDYSS